MFVAATVALSFIVADISSLESKDTLLQLVEGRALALDTLGSQHPETIELNGLIDARVSRGETVKPRDAETRLQTLIDERSLLKRQYGLRHRKMRSNAALIRIVAEILSGQPVR